MQLLIEVLLLSGGFILAFQGLKRLLGLSGIWLELHVVQFAGEVCRHRLTLESGLLEGA